MLLRNDVGDDVHDNRWVGLIVGHTFDKLLHSSRSFLQTTISHAAFKFFEVRRIIWWFQEECAYAHWYVLIFKSTESASKHFIGPSNSVLPSVASQSRSLSGNSKSYQKQGKVLNFPPQYRYYEPSFLEQTSCSLLFYPLQSLRSAERNQHIDL